MSCAKQGNTCSYWNKVKKPYQIYVSESDILGPNGNLSNIKNLVSFERELFEDSSYEYRIKIFL